METIFKINTIVFDKTGTITTGRPEVTDIIVLETGANQEEFLKHIATAEKKSEHPLGAAIYEKGKAVFGAELADPSAFETVPGGGIRAAVENRQVLVGNLPFLKESGIDMKNAQALLDRLSEQGKTAVAAAVDGRVTGIVALADKLRKNVPETIQALKKQGNEIYMITGDNGSAANAVADTAGIAHVLADVRPENKAEEIQALKKDGRIVAMVGDGINDAPALAAADIGFAIGGGTDVAIETGDVVLLSNDFLTLPASIRLSGKTIRKIRQNLFWAFVYNVVAIPFAASGHLNPTVAAAAMALSSVSVLLNSLSLKRAEISE